MRPLSIRVPEEIWQRIEWAKVTNGGSTTDAVRAALENGLPPLRPVEPPTAATSFCLHPEGKRVGQFCVACMSDALV